MIKWEWVLLYSAAAFFLGFLLARFGYKRQISGLWRSVNRYRLMSANAEEERRKYADALRKKGLEVDTLKRNIKRGRK